MKYEGSITELRHDNELSDKGQYKYVGSFQEKGVVRIFIFLCTVCEKDKELFGDGLFWTRKQDFKNNQLFCGCAKKVTWTLEQSETKSIRAASEAGNTFEGIIEPYIGGSSRCNLSCAVCNHKWTSKLSNLWALKRGCPSCRTIKFLTAAKFANLKPDSIITKSFMETGAYHPHTIFTKIDRKAKNSKTNYWSVYCPICEETSECQQGHLLKGSISCGCSMHNQMESYINLVKDGDEVVAIKFGISKDSHKRLVSHNYNTTYNVEMLSIFKYDKSIDCKAAERECLDTLACGIIEKEMFHGGWTETTYPYNIDVVSRIFKKFGGVRIF
jgi:hypothetical protein